MKKTLIILFVLIHSILAAQSIDNSWKNAQIAKQAKLSVVYLDDNFPYAYKDNSGNLVGLEVDILKEFKLWVKSKKNVDITFEFKPYKEFNEVYSLVKNSKENNLVGIASVSITDQRKKEVGFSPAYIRNTLIMRIKG